jgi:glycosyltransferase involved in cell wall biosynthesis
MKINLLRPIPDEGRVSMEVYADALAASLRGLVRDDDTVREVRYSGPGGGRAASLRLTRYLRRYAMYQAQVASLSGDVHHIVDHGYGHLAFSLSAQRTIVTFHDAVLLRAADGELPMEGLSRLAVLGQRLSLSGVRRVARVLVDSEQSRQDFLRYVPFDPDRVTVVPLGVAPRFQRTDGSSLDATLGPKPRLLHVGHCAFYKNVEGILRAVALLLADGSPVTFVKVGAAFTPAQKELIRKLGISTAIKHLGYISDAELPRVYSAADFLVAPSFHEGFGLPVLEAMACGTPVIASNRGSHSEVVGDAGLLIDPNEPSELAEAVRTLEREPGLRRALVARGLRRAETFTWGRTAAATLAVYRQVAAEN